MALIREFLVMLLLFDAWMAGPANLFSVTVAGIAISFMCELKMHG